MKKPFKTLISIMLLLVVALCGINLRVDAAIVSPESSFWVKFIDVGQGDAALVQCDGEYMLIDGGPADASSVIYTILKDNKIDRLDVMVATHPDSDHIGGLAGALNYAKVGNCYCSVKEHDTDSFKALQKHLKKQNISITVPTAGEKIKLGSAEVKILAPIGTIDDTNNSSIVLRITYDKNSFLFMGDAELVEENHILSRYKDLRSDLIKIGHHGSESSTSGALLNAVKPGYAIISVGKDNSYGHPTQPALDRIAHAKSSIYRTDLHGDITATSDGKTVTITTEKTASADKVTQNSKVIVAVPPQTTYVLNHKSMKFHLPTCSSVGDMSLKNREDVTLSRDEVVEKGFDPCKRCKP